MKIKQLAEIAWKFTYDGRPKATAQQLSIKDITQMCLLAFGEIVRMKFYESKRSDSDSQADYSFTSPLLSIKKFALEEEIGINGVRRASMDKYDLFRLPNNAHITNVYPLGSGCNGEVIGQITQVAPAEENFYLTPDFSSFLFFVVKGRGINTYHVPFCIKEVEIETTFSTDDIDISMDLGYEVVMAVLGTSIKVNGIPIKILDNPYMPKPTEVRNNLAAVDQQI